MLPQLGLERGFISPCHKALYGKALAYAIAMLKHLNLQFVLQKGNRKCS